MEKILLVENNRQELDAIARFLKNHGYDILTAADGKSLWFAKDQDGGTSDALMPSISFNSSSRRIRRWLFSGLA